ncbi:MAG: hypothetical protein HQM11_17665 [SAR324 cluster bacterium]|nr:hypothetical protein [SAR324 cluster bacterium]
MIIKKLFYTAVASMLCGGTLLAQEAPKKTEATLITKGSVNAYAKMQDNYITPLDLGSGDRHGANNRSNQTSRATGNLTFITTSGSVGESDGRNIPQMVGVAVIKMDANDPDHPSTIPTATSGEASAGGKNDTRVYLGDVWARYSPWLPLGIKIGYQSFASTSVAAGTKVYDGDAEDDFQAFRGATTLKEVPGISLDFHPMKEMEIGIATTSGMGDASKIMTGGKANEASNNVVWVNGKFSMVKFDVGMQQVAVGKYTSGENAPYEYAHTYKHTLINASVMMDFGMVKPYVGYQSASGDKARAIVTAGTLDALPGQLRAGLGASVDSAVKAGYKTLLVAAGMSSTKADEFIAADSAFSEAAITAALEADGKSAALAAASANAIYNNAAAASLKDVTPSAAVSANTTAQLSSTGIGNFKNLEVSANEDLAFEGNIITAGLILDFNDNGALGIDYTMINAPAYGESGYMPALLEVKTALMTNYTIPLKEGASVTLFYHMLGIQEDSKLRSDLDTAAKNAAQADDAATVAALGTSTSGAVKGGYESFVNAAGRLKWSNTASMGVAFNVKF